jgi:hypothetical protein
LEIRSDILLDGLGDGSSGVLVPALPCWSRDKILSAPFLLFEDGLPQAPGVTQNETRVPGRKVAIAALAKRPVATLTIH